MFDMQSGPPLSTHIQSKVDSVVRLLRAEAKSHGSEAWYPPCQRVSKVADVAVRLVEMDFNGSPGTEPPHGNTHLETALSDSYVIVEERAVPWRVSGPKEVTRWWFAFKFRDWTLPEDHPSEDERRAEPPAPSTQAEAALNWASSFGNGKDARGPDVASQSPAHMKPPGPTLPPIYNEAYLIQEFDRRERERGPIFAGFIVNDLLPRMGFNTSDAKKILRAMEAQNMVRTEHKPNPKQPDRTTTFVTLNRQHPHVARVLQGASAIHRKFPIGTVIGEALSETIIRERL